MLPSSERRANQQSVDCERRGGSAGTGLRDSGAHNITKQMCRSAVQTKAVLQ